MLVARALSTRCHKSPEHFTRAAITLAIDVARSVKWAHDLIYKQSHLPLASMHWLERMRFGILNADQRARVPEQKAICSQIKSEAVVLIALMTTL